MADRPLLCVLRSTHPLYREISVKLAIEDVGLIRQFTRAAISFACLQHGMKDYLNQFNDRNLPVQPRLQDLAPRRAWRVHLVLTHDHPIWRLISKDTEVEKIQVVLDRLADWAYHQFRAEEFNLALITLLTGSVSAKTIHEPAQPLSGIAPAHSPTAAHTKNSRLPKLTQGDMNLSSVTARPQTLVE